MTGRRTNKPISKHVNKHVNKHISTIMTTIFFSIIIFFPAISIIAFIFRHDKHIRQLLSDISAIYLIVVIIGNFIFQCIMDIVLDKK